MVNNLFNSCSYLLRPIILGFITIICCSNILAQNSKTDSLLNVIVNAKDESSRLIAINQLAFSMATSNPDSSLLLVKEIYPAVQSNDAPSLLVDVMYTKAWIYENRLQLDSALIFYEETKDLAAQTNDLVDLAHCLVQIGQIYREKNEFDKGFKILREALEVAAESEDKNVEMRAANALGRSYSYLGKFDSSNIYLHKALEIQKTLDNQRLVAELYVNISNNNGRAGQVDLEISNLLKAQEIMRELNDLPGISLTFRNIAVSHFFSGAYPKALENLHKVLETVEGTKYDDEIIINLDYLGEVYMTIEDYENAQLYWEKANGNKKNPDFSFKKGWVLFLIKDYENALQAFLETEKLKEESGQFIGGDLYWNIGNIYEQLSNNEAAQLNYTRAVELSQNSEQYFTRTKSLYGLGKINESKGRPNEARSNFKETFEIAVKGELKENEMEAAPLPVNRLPCSFGASA